MKKIIIPILISASLSPNLIAQNLTQEIEGLYASKLSPKSSWARTAPEDVQRYIFVSKNQIKEYHFDATAVPEEAEQTIEHQIIGPGPKKNTYAVRNKNDKIIRILYAGQFGRRYAFSILGLKGENLRDKPSTIWLYEKIPEYYQGKFRKHLGLKTKTLGDSSYGGTSYQVKLPARAEIDSEGGCRSIYLKPETPWKEVGCLKHKVKVTIKKALPEKTKNRWGDEGTMIYVVSDTADGWMLDQYLKIKK